MEELGAGEVVGGMVDVCNETREPSRVKFEPEKINKLLGTNLTKEEMLGYLGRVELAYDEKNRRDRCTDIPSGYPLQCRCCRGGCKILRL